MSRRGFTLVEVLTALLIFGLIAAAGTGLIAAAIDGRLAVKGLAERTGDLQRARALMKADLGQATARRTRGPTGRALQQPVVGAQRPGDPLLVVARAGWSNPDGRARPSLQRVEYRLIDGRLERRSSAFLDGARAGSPQVLYRGVKDVSVTFLRDGGEAPAFIASPERPLPDAVRVVMTLDGYGVVDQLFLVGSGR